MIYLQFLFGLLCYMAIAYVSYDQSIKNTVWYYPAGISAAILANTIWLWIASRDVNSSSLMIKGLFWDAMIVGCYLSIPLLLFGAQLSSRQSIGVVLVVAGLFLTKV